MLNISVEYDNENNNLKQKIYSASNGRFIKTL